MLSYQGKLTDTMGIPVPNSDYSVTFRLYTVPSGGSAFWSEAQSVVTREGLFSVILGSVTPIGSVPDGGALYLGMAVDGGAELVPRLRIASAAYSYLAARASNADLLQGRDTTTFSRGTHNHDATYVNEGQADAISSAMITNGAVQTADVADTNVTMAKVAQAGATTGQVVKWTGSAWAPGPDNTGGGSGVTNVYQDTGIVCVPNPITSSGNVKLDLSYGDGRYINEAQANSITGAMITDGQVGTADIRDTTVSTADIKDAAVTAVKLNQMGASISQVLKWTTSGWGPRNDSIGGGSGDSAWVRGTPDSVLYTIRRLGIARGGADNMLHGSQRQTHVNLGIACTTGTVSQVRSYVTIGGGVKNVASGDASTIAGGDSNTVSGARASVGGGHTNVANAVATTVAGGWGNTASNEFASIGGGYRNSARGDYATVGGGYRDSASGIAATVGGGSGNGAVQHYATVGGGRVNTASDTGATVGGGDANSSGARYATVGGGQNDSASGEYSTVGGGAGNRAGGSRATVGGGWNNLASGDRSTIAGGYLNTSGGAYSAIPGGFGNYANGAYTVAAGNRDTVRGWCGGGLSGYLNLAGDAAADTCAVVAGGRVNRATAKYATVGGGFSNAAETTYSTIGGGYDNDAFGYAATISGGWTNSATRSYATVSGGYTNAATGSSATVGGGNSNAAETSYATVGGGILNAATGYAATVGGGNSNAAETSYATVGGGYGNDATGYGATVGGGYDNNASDDYATVGGGKDNAAESVYATVSGGRWNNATGYGATVCGGQTNRADTSYATVGGGYSNNATGYTATVGGGYDNAASGNDAAVPGGVHCDASGNRSFAAGCYAKARGAGSFVWSDSCEIGDSVRTTTDNRWVARARGGVYFYTNLGMTTGSHLSPGGSSWNSVSDSMTKENFRPVDKKALLETLARMRVRDYNLKSQDASIRHIGPVAQDFHAAFGFGESNTAINMEDADGVALAAIQALYEDNKQLRQELEALKAELAQQNR